MRNYKIIADSTCDLNANLEKEFDIEVMPLSFTIDGKTYQNFLDGREINLDDFYKKMEEGHNPKTSQINANSIEEVFRKYLELGNDILYICISSGISGTFNSARIAKEMLEEEYKDAKIIVIDSLCASAGEGLLVSLAVNKKKEGLSIEDNAKYLDKIKFNIKHSFTVLDVEYLKRGGRLKATAAFAAKVLNIKPVLYVNDEGKLIARGKKHGRKAAISSILNEAINGINTTDEFMTIVAGASCKADCDYCKAWLEEKYKELNVKSNIVITNIGPVIGSHSGPGTLAIFTLCDKR